MWAYHIKSIGGQMAIGIVLANLLALGILLGCSDSEPNGPNGDETWTFTDSLFDSGNLYWGVVCTAGSVLDKVYLIIDHDDAWKIPYWVAYHLRKGDFDERWDTLLSYSFRVDTTLPENARSTDLDYDEPVYDRGHNAPSRTFSRGPAACSTTHWYSNVCPQTQMLNRGRWRILEEEVREHVDLKGEAWVFTGSLFLDANGMNGRIPPDTIGPNLVGVPSHCFKAILSMSPDSVFCAYAFIMPNDTVSIPGTSRDYLIPVDSLEAVTHYDFFYRLPDVIENTIESESNTNWPDICTGGLW